MSSFSSIRTTHNWIRVCTQVLGDCRTTLFNHISWWFLCGFLFLDRQEILTDGRLLEIKYFYVPPFSLLHAFPSKQKMACGKPSKQEFIFQFLVFRGRISWAAFAVWYHSTQLALCTAALPRESVKRHTFTSTECARPKQKLTRENLKHGVFLDTWMSTVVELVLVFGDLDLWLEPLA